MLGMNFILCVIMINLFVLVTLQQYDEFVSKKENPIEKFQELLDSFKKSWNKYSSEKDKGYKIKHNQVSDFLMDFEWNEMSLFDCEIGSWFASTNPFHVFTQVRIACIITNQGRNTLVGRKLTRKERGKVVEEREVDLENEKEYRETLSTYFNLEL